MSKVLFYSGALRLLGPLANRYVLSRRRTAFIKRRRSNSFQILLYHRVNDDRDPFLPSTPTELFRRQMQYLARNATVCSLEDAVDGLQGDDLSENVVVVTFDDGYRDNYTHAFPILKDLSLTATIFLATDSIGSRRILWHDRVFRAFNRTRVPRLDGFGPHAASYALGTEGDKVRSREDVLAMFKRMREEDRAHWIDRLVERLEVEDPREVPDLMMNWDEVRQIHRSGVSIGSHTVTHPILSTLPVARARAEIAESKATIERELGAPIRTFAYPNGQRRDFTEQTKELLKQAGYACAVTTLFGVNGGDSTTPDLLELKRDPVWSKTPHEFATRLTYYKFAS